MILKVVLIAVGAFFYLGGWLWIIYEIRHAPYPWWHPTFYCANCNETSCKDCAHIERAKERGELYPYKHYLKEAR
jgi:hypothetical protein